MLPSSPLVVVEPPHGGVGSFGSAEFLAVSDDWFIDREVPGVPSVAGPVASVSLASGGAGCPRFPFAPTGPMPRRGAQRP